MNTFNTQELKQVWNDLNEIQRFALKHYDENPVLFNIIDHLARVGGMFASIKKQELEGNVQTIDPHKYILNKLSIAHDNMQHYTETANK